MVVTIIRVSNFLGPSDSRAGTRPLPHSPIHKALSATTFQRTQCRHEKHSEAVEDPSILDFEDEAEDGDEDEDRSSSWLRRRQWQRRPFPAAKSSGGGFLDAASERCDIAPPTP